MKLQCIQQLVTIHRLSLRLLGVFLPGHSRRKEQAFSLPLVCSQRIVLQYM